MLRHHHMSSSIHRFRQLRKAAILSIIQVMLHNILMCRRPRRVVASISQTNTTVLLFLLYHKLRHPQSIILVNTIIIGRIQGNNTCQKIRKHSRTRKCPLFHITVNNSHTGSRPLCSAIHFLSRESCISPDRRKEMLLPLQCTIQAFRSRHRLSHLHHHHRHKSSMKCSTIPNITWLQLLILPLPTRMSLLHPLLLSQHLSSMRIRPPCREPVEPSRHRRSPP
mmetsp:Transcript_34490/g.63620  ORF Transcript_34490/g.63620 Transcript_34490/m.63620 type:complete len:223 (-) Transcript_34490:905-1573(-)